MGTRYSHYIFYCMIVSLWLWQTPAFPNIHGLIQFIASKNGGAPWMLLAPLFLGLTAIELLVPVSGRFSFTFLTAVAALVIGSISFLAFQGTSSDIPDWNTLLSLLGLFVLLFPILALAAYDHPRLDSPLARFAFSYQGRLTQMRMMQQFSQERQLYIHGPEGMNNALTVNGSFDATHSFTLVSRMHMSWSKDDTSGGTMLQVMMTVSHNIGRFYCGKRRLPKPERRGLLEIKVAPPKQNTFYTYIQSSSQLSPQIQQQIIDHVEQRHGILPNAAIVQSESSRISIRFRKWYLPMTGKESNFSEQLQWLYQLITILESNSSYLSSMQK
jgi:hypothetical protein